MAQPLATCGILSIGEMGLGIAKLLVASNFRVITNVTGRSQSTHERAESASVQLVSTDEELAEKSDYILSIVPPRDALPTAQRILKASSSAAFGKRNTPLYYLDMNAISPRSARDLAELFKSKSSQIRFIDGGIIGAPPKLKEASAFASDLASWTRPSIPVSGPDPLDAAEHGGAQLAKVLNSKHIAIEIGQASGLKMSFASLTKGFTSLAIQSFTTAHRLGVLTELQQHLEQYSPKSLDLANKGIVAMPPKAYRWVREMEEINDTFAVDGGFDQGESMFAGVAKTYALVADGTELGEEKPGKRVKGQTPEEVARLMSEGIDQRKVKTD